MGCQSERTTCELPTSISKTGLKVALSRKTSFPLLSPRPMEVPVRTQRSSGLKQQSVDSKRLKRSPLECTGDLKLRTSHSLRVSSPPRVATWRLS